MDAECTGCGGRVMPYRQYVLHFRPTAVCAACGSRVRLRHFARVLVGFAAILAAYTLVLWLAESRVFIAVGLALAVLASLLADFWTFRNLPWDPVEGGEGPPEPSA